MSLCKQLDSIPLFSLLKNLKIVMMMEHIAHLSSTTHLAWTISRLLSTLLRLPIIPPNSTLTNTISNMEVSNISRCFIRKLRCSRTLRIEVHYYALSRTVTLGCWCTSGWCRIPGSLDCRLRPQLPSADQGFHRPRSRSTFPFRIFLAMNLMALFYLGRNYGA